MVLHTFVMAGLDPAIQKKKDWITGSSPVMTNGGFKPDDGKRGRFRLEHVAQSLQPVLRAQHAIKQKLRACCAKVGTGFASTTCDKTKT
jgi:hypothetical protein